MFVKYIILVVLFLVVGCNKMSNESVGSLSGAAIGALAGSSIAGNSDGKVFAIAAGTFAGALIGGNIGRKMDKLDRLEVSKALESQPTNSTTTWVNPDSKIQYEVTPINTVEEKGDGPCREFITKANIGGQEEKVYGKACRKQDGSWEIR